MRPLAHPVAISNPNGALMYATHEAELDIPLLPAAARRVYIIPDLSTAPLIAVAPLCDAGCIVTFTKTTATVHLGPKLLLTGSRDPNNGLWHLDMPDPNHANPSPLHEQTESAAATIDHRTSPANLVAFAHASLFSPALSTLHDALCLGYITGVPGLTAETLRRHPPSSIATTKGHLDQIRKNLRSTKPNAPPPPPPPKPPTIRMTTSPPPILLTTKPITASPPPLNHQAKFTVTSPENSLPPRLLAITISLSCTTSTPMPSSPSQ